MVPDDYLETRQPSMPTTVSPTFKAQYFFRLLSPRNLSLYPSICPCRGTHLNISQRHTAVMRIVYICNQCFRDTQYSFSPTSDREESRKRSKTHNAKKLHRQISTTQKYRRSKINPFSNFPPPVRIPSLAFDTPCYQLTARASEPCISLAFKQLNPCDTPKFLFLLAAAFSSTIL